MNPRRALVTGAAGFVGANLVRRLLSDGHTVEVVIRPGGDPWRLAPIADHVAVREVDLCDSGAVTAMVADSRPEWLFNLAAHGAYRWQREAGRIMATNVVSTAELVEACASNGCEAFVQAGTSSEYGFKDRAPHEDEPLEPNGAYAVAKAAAGLYCRQAGRSGRLSTVVLRLYSVFGPYEDPARLVPQLIVHGRAGGLPPLVDPGVAHDFVAVEDVVEAFMLAAERAGPLSGSALNVGSGRQTTLAQAVETARRTFGLTAEPAWRSAPDREWDTACWVSDPSGARERLGWEATTSFETGFRRAAAWLESTPEVAGRYGDDR